MTKTQSFRTKGNGTVGQAGQLTAIALVFAFVCSPIGLILYFFAKQKEKQSTFLTAALIISIIGTIFWILAAVLWIPIWWYWGI